MDTIKAMMRGEAALRAGAKVKVFDWEKAIQILVPDVKEAEAGLSGDLEYTAGRIWTGGGPYYDDYTYLASNWATPVLIIDGAEVECWRYKDETPGWGSGSKWPNLPPPDATP